MTALPQRTTAPPSALSALDWIAAGLGLLLAGVLVVFAVVHIPRFRGMFADVGAELPWVTRVVLSAWPPLLVSALAVGLTIAGLALTHHALGLRRALLVAAFFVPLLGLGLCLAGVYLPIFQLAGAVR